jgi:hypothetical protein
MAKTFAVNNRLVLQHLSVITCDARVLNAILIFNVPHFLVFSDFAHSQGALIAILLPQIDVISKNAQVIVSAMDFVTVGFVQVLKHAYQDHFLILDAMESNAKIT